MPSARVTFADLWASHPATCGDLNPCAAEDGKPLFENQCAIRMGVALEKAGLSLSSFNGARCWHGHRHGHRHVLRAQELADWLRKQSARIGPVQIHQRVSAARFAGQRGIIFFRDFWGAGNRGDHIDLWDGEKMGCGDNDYFTRAREVWFWPLP